MDDLRALAYPQVMPAFDTLKSTGGDEDGRIGDLPRVFSASFMSVVVLTLVVTSCSSFGSGPSSPADAGGMADASDARVATDGGTRNGVLCGTQVCPIGCCTGASECPASTAECFSDRGAGGAIECDGAEDCPGKDVCCVYLAARAHGAACSSTCEADFTACHSDSECALSHNCSSNGNAVGSLKVCTPR